MSSKSLQLLARRPLCYPGFTRKLLVEQGIAERFEPHDILYLTPNKRRARSAEFEILSLYQEKALQTPTCLTIQTLAESLLKPYSSKGIIDERDRRFILLKLIRESKNLPFREEHLGLLSNLYAEFRRYHPEEWHKIPAISREVIFDMDTATRLAQAIELLEEYDRYLAAEDLIDHEAVLAEACSYVSFLPHKLLIIEGYFEPRVAEQRLFDALLGHVHQVLVIIPDDPLAAKGEEFFARYDLSQRPTPKPLPPPEFTWQRFPSREDEVVAIARRICALAEGVYPNDIIVVFPDLYTYRPIVERVFTRYGLNPSLSLRPRLAGFPGIKVILDLLQAAEQGFRRRDVVGLLLSPAFKNVPESVRRWIDMLSRDEGVISGEKTWTDWFLSDTPWKLKDHPEAAAVCSQMRGFLKEFTQQLKRLAQPASIQDFTQRLESILDWLGWEVDEVLQRGFREAVEKFVRMAELAGEVELSPRFIRETLGVLLGKEIPKPEDETHDAIRVMPLVESRWLDARYLFVGGLIDGEFPKRPYRDLLLPEKLRDALELPTAQGDFADAEFEFRRLRSMPSEHVFSSAASMEDDRPLLPTVFLAEEKEGPKIKDPLVYCEEEQQLLEPRDRGEPQEGVVFTDPASVALIGTRFGPTRPFRVTSLEVYRTCPYRYFLRAVLGLEPYEEPTAEPEARLLGTIMHSVLERLFKADPDPEQMDDLLWNELISELDKRRLNPFVRLWIEDWVRSRKDWLCDEERARAEAGWQVDPSWLERPLELFFKKEGFSLKGRVDRVDWQGRRARVLDYKTGKERDFRRKIEKGYSIQLPIYCEMIRRSHDAEIASFGLYNLVDAKFDEVSSSEAQMLAALGFVQEAVAGIREGLFPSQENQACRYCEYREFCEVR